MVLSNLPLISFYFAQSNKNEKFKKKKDEKRPKIFLYDPQTRSYLYILFVRMNYEIEVFVEAGLGVSFVYVGNWFFLE